MGSVLLCSATPEATYNASVLPAIGNNLWSDCIPGLCQEANGILEVDVWWHGILQLVDEMLDLKPFIPRLECLDDASIQRLQMTRGGGRQVVQANTVELYVREMARHIV